MAATGELVIKPVAGERSAQAVQACPRRTRRLGRRSQGRHSIRASAHSLAGHSHATCTRITLADRPVEESADQSQHEENAEDPEQRS